MHMKRGSAGPADPRLMQFKNNHPLWFIRSEVITLIKYNSPLPVFFGFYTRGFNYVIVDISCDTNLLCDMPRHERPVYIRHEIEFARLREHYESEFR